MAKTKSLLTKVARGIAFGDVSNASVRNILTEISKRVYGGITEQELHDTMDFFDWKCPYTGKDLKAAVKQGLGGHATDHIDPQNRECCGLNVKGNLVIVDKAANSEKGNKTVEEFFGNKNSKVLAGVDAQTREARLKKIREFQKICGYDPIELKKTLSPLLKQYYDNVRAEQEKRIEDALKTARLTPLAVQKKAVKVRSGKKQALPAIVFSPADEAAFKKELLIRKKATFVLTYDSGAVKESPWKADNMNESSNLRGNIQSRPFWRNKNKEGLVKVEVLFK